MLNELSRQFGFSHLLQRSPLTLSGGEAQRVLLARAFAAIPKIILLDEPLSAVDSDQRDQLKSLLRKINRNGLTIIHVTHDFEEAFSLATNMGIMHNGALIESGKPDEIITKPNSKFAARFYGYKNYFEGVYKTPDSILMSGILMKVDKNASLGKKVSLLVDEEKIEVLTKEKKHTYGFNCFEGKIIDFFNTIAGQEIIVRLNPEINFYCRKSPEILSHFQINQEVKIHIPPAAISLISR
jgi:molybdate/tungstate transport system ATP-binding protein